jgi:hypothetical protein
MSIFKKTKQVISFEEILKGKKAGKSQKVGIMEVIPIFYQSRELMNFHIALPGESMLLKKIPNYGEVVLENEDENDLLIVPVHTGFITPQKSQDHAIAKGGIITSKTSYHYKDAFCIQETQGGYIPPGHYDFIILPYSLRHKAIKMKDKSGYSRLWEDISLFNREVGIKKGTAHLEYFYQTFSEELEEFIAQFEIEPDQVGAIILIANQVVGIELAPNPDYWKNVWEPLIRSCYGAETIRQLLLNPDVRGEGKLSPEEIENISSIDDLESVIAKLKNTNQAKVEEIIENLLDKKMQAEVDITTTQQSGSIDSQFELLTLEEEIYRGQVVREDGVVVYASITADPKKLAAKSKFRMQKS